MSESKIAGLKAKGWFVYYLGEQAAKQAATDLGTNLDLVGWYPGKWVFGCPGDEPLFTHEESDPASGYWDGPFFTEQAAWEEVIARFDP